MSNPLRASAVIFAKDNARLARFYTEVLKARTIRAEPGYEVLQLADIELVIHAIPEHIANTFETASPPALREDASIKLAFPVVSLESTRKVVTSLGGVAHGRSWQGEGFTACDVSDPEGNVLQLREAAHS